MKQMKKTTLSILMASAILALSSCGTTPIQETTTSSTSIATTATEAKPTETTEPLANFEEIVVVDNEQCTIKITGIETDSIWGYTLKTYMENKSSDKTYMFAVDNAAINGVQCDPFFATEIAAEKKSNEKISFSDAELKENGITDFTDIEISFRVYDSNDWMADSAAEETVHIYPYGKDKVTTYIREPKSSDNVIIDNENITVIIIGYENNDIWGYTAKLFLVNKTDKEVMFTVDEASVNGFMADPFFAISVMPKKCTFSSMSWSSSIFEENGITDVEKIEFLFRAYDANDWMADDFANEAITLHP